MNLENLQLCPPELFSEKLFIRFILAISSYTDSYTACIKFLSPLSFGILILVLVSDICVNLFCAVCCGYLCVLLVCINTADCIAVCLSQDPLIKRFLISGDKTNKQTKKTESYN